MKLLKKLMITALTISIVSVTALTSVNAEEIGNVLGINQDNAAFSELVLVENRKTYIPLRLAFPNLNDTENKIGMTIGWGTSYPVIHLIYGSTTGGPLLDGAAPYDGIRKCVDIFWEGDLNQGVKAYLSVIEYTYNEDGERRVISMDDDQVLDDTIFARDVVGGSRVFVSVDDISKLAKLLQVDSAYSVKLYK